MLLAFSSLHLHLINIPSAALQDEKVEVIKKIHELIEDNGNGWPTYFVKGLAWPIFAVYEQWTGIVSKSNSWLNAEELKDLVEELAER